MTTPQPSGVNTYSPKIRDQSLVRRFLAQHGRGYIALSIIDGVPGTIVSDQSKPVDPDPGSLTLQVWFDDVTNQFPPAVPGVSLFTVTQDQITRTGPGAFYYEIGPPNTSYRGTLTAQWGYTINGVAFTFMDFLQIQGQMPFYDSLNQQEQSIVEQVTFMLGDAFDSTEGGPQLIEPFQTHYDYERIAQMERIAVTRFNLMSTFSNPPSTYGVGPGTQTVPAQFAGLMVLGTYLETVRHLIRSYVEMPAFQGANVTYVDRRDYFDRWNQVLQSEWPEYQLMVRNAKIGMLDLARGPMLVGGGIYGGNANGLFIAGGYAAQTRSFRFYPAAPAISWGASAHGSGFPSAL